MPSRCCHKAKRNGFGQGNSLSVRVAPVCKRAIAACLWFPLARKSNFSSVGQALPTADARMVKVAQLSDMVRIV